MSYFFILVTKNKLRNIWTICKTEMHWQCFMVNKQWVGDSILVLKLAWKIELTNLQDIRQFKKSAAWRQTYLRWQPHNKKWAGLLIIHGDRVSITAECKYVYMKSVDSVIMDVCRGLSEAMFEFLGSAILMCWQT